MYIQVAAFGMESLSGVEATHGEASDTRRPITFCPSDGNTSRNQMLSEDNELRMGYQVEDLTQGAV